MSERIIVVGLDPDEDLQSILDDVLGDLEFSTTTDGDNLCIDVTAPLGLDRLGEICVDIEFELIDYAIEFEEVKLG